VGGRRFSTHLLVRRVGPQYADDVGADNAASQPEPDIDVAVAAIEQAFARLFVVVKARMREAAATVDPEIQPATWTVLRQVLRSPSAHPGDIVAATGMDKSAVSRHLKLLRSRGLVDMIHSPEDGRSIIVTPTDSARAGVATAADLWNERYRGFLETWSAADLATFTSLLDRFADVDQWKGEE
jgi:DNA-binding MarR family transcriptional regulator